jgi:hypothetical protein
MMKFNIACASQGCTDPVIGQCPGYGGQPCGKFYCATHTRYNLCGACALKREVDQRDTEYLRLAEAVEPDAKHESEHRLIGRLGAMASIVFMILLLIGLVSVFTPLDVSTEFQNVGGLIAIACFGFSLLAGTYCRILARHILKSKVRFLDSTKPGFAHYFRIWKANKSQAERKAVLSAVGATLLGVVVAGIGAAMEDERKLAESAQRQDDVRRGVDEALRQRGL